MPQQSLLHRRWHGFNVYLVKEFRNKPGSAFTFVQLTREDLNTSHDIKQNLCFLDGVSVETLGTHVIFFHHRLTICLQPQGFTQKVHEMLESRGCEESQTIGQQVCDAESTKTLSQARRADGEAFYCMCARVEGGVRGGTRYLLHLGRLRQYTHIYICIYIIYIYIYAG